MKVKKEKLLQLKTSNTTKKDQPNNVGNKKNKERTNNKKIINKTITIQKIMIIIITIIKFKETIKITNHKMLM